MTSGNPDTPRQQDAKRVEPQTDPANKSANSEIKSPVVSKIPPAPTYACDTQYCRYESTPRWKKILEIAVFIVGLSIAVIYYCQLKTMQETLKVDQRAWVGMKFAKITTLAPQEKIVVNAVLVNTGKTFALNTTVDAVLMSDHHPIDVDEYAKKLPEVKPPSVSTLFPGLEVAITAKSDNILNEATVNAVKAGTEYTYFFGDIRYDDIFEVKHLTRFCYFYSTDLQTLQTCDRHNYAN